MNIIEAITAIDELKPNNYSQEQKIQWLSKLDGMVKTHIINTHEGAEAITFTGYTEDTDPNTKLLVPAPYDSMYLRWLEAQIDYHNGEYGKYNNSITTYQAEFEAYSNYYNRTHMPNGRGMRFF